MKDLTKEQKDVVSMLYDLEYLINDEKSWIQIANCVSNYECDEVDIQHNLYLTLSMLENQNNKLFSSYENLLSAIYNLF